MPDESDKYLNKLARERLPDEGREWFRALSSEQQKVVLRKLWFFAAQGGATSADVEAATRRAQLKLTDTSSVLLRGASLKVGAAKVIGLPPTDREKAYRMLMALFQVADERRRETSCRGACTHWWHAEYNQVK